MMINKAVTSIYRVLYLFLASQAVVTFGYRVVHEYDVILVSIRSYSPLEIPKLNKGGGGDSIW